MQFGCATWQTPDAVDEVALRSRAVTVTNQGVRLSAAVLSADDSRRLFGADVNASGIQPVWVEVHNGGAEMLWLLRAGTDPDYFSPLEVAWSFHAPLSGARNQAIDDHFNEMAFQNPIPPGSTRSGVIFTNPHHRTRLLNVDLLGQRRAIPFTLFLPIPDDPPDTEAVQIVERYVEADKHDLQSEAAFSTALQQLPCCANDVDSAMSSAPVNIVFVGAFSDVGAALQRRGYRSDRWQIDDRQKLFGRRPDIVGRKAGQGGAPAHWLRLWVAPMHYLGQPVFVGQVGRPVGGRFATAQGNDVQLHPDVDEARNLLVQDLLYSGGLAKLGFIGGAGSGGEVSQDAYRHAAHYSSDGLRAVLFFVTRPLALSDIEFLNWEPYLERRMIEAAAEHKHEKP